MRLLNVVFTVIALAFLLSVQPHNATRVLEGENREYLIEKGHGLSESPQQMGPVTPSTPNTCEKAPIGGPPCKHPPASPARAHATTPAVKVTMHK
uniref:Uncharacterized protein n=1 Tax=Vitis vinifera TaxID=29760 RepID=A5BVY0_VITVI|nr:hypothetical protein VITISV_044221 [Vitis vinifera]